MKNAVQIIVCVLLCSTVVIAQDRPDPNMPQGINLEVPVGWDVRLDREIDDVIISSSLDSSDIYFVNMTPGWHITTGPAGIFYHPANTASGNFTITSELHFFDPGNRNREAYGVFIGGTNLQGDNQHYVYFLIRNTGEFLIKKRVGEETEMLHKWTASNSIIKFDPEVTENSSVMNTLSVVVGDNEVSFHINDEQVASLNASDIETNGIFGLRVNHSINLHVSDLSFTSNN